MSRLVACILAYILSVLLIKLIFTILKRVIGEKLIGSDLFGRLEYYLGMLAGMLRFFCMLVVFLSLLNSRLYTPEELAEDAKAMEKDFGTITFPNWGSLQQEVFEKSVTGRFVKQHIRDQLMPATHYERPVTTAETIGKRRQSDLDEVVGGKPKK